MRAPLDFLPSWPTRKLPRPPASRFRLSTNISTDEGFKSSVHMSENMLDPSTAFSQDPTAAPFSRAYGNGKRLGIWDWFEQPGNEKYLRRFGIAMHGTSKLMPPDHVLSGLFYVSSCVTTFNTTTGYDWKSLKPGSLVVDVGGGIGSSILPVAKAFPTLHFVIQDRPHVVAQGLKVNFFIHVQRDEIG